MARRDQTNLEILLGEWARWKNPENRYGLGYYKRSAFARMRVDCDRIEADVAKLADDPLVQIDAAINDLCPAFKLAIKIAYLEYGTVREKCHRMKISQSIYMADLRAAKMQLSYVMGGKYAEECEYA